MDEFFRNTRRVAVGCVVLFFILTTFEALFLTDGAGGKLRFAHTFTTAAERSIIDDAVNRFQRSSGGAEVEQVVFNSEVYQNLAWRLQFRGRRKPDVFFHWDGWKVSEAAGKGWARDLGPLLSEEFAATFVEAGLSRADEEAVYLVPQSIDISNLVWYNADLFQAKGWSVPRTLEEWKELCLRIREEGHLPLVQGNRDLWPMGNLAAELMGQTLGRQGYDEFFQENTETDLSDWRGLQVLFELERGGCFEKSGVVEPGGVATMSDTDAKVLFLTGQAAQHVVGSWFLADIQDAMDRGELKFEVDFFLVPSDPEDWNAAVGVVTGYLMSSSCGEPEVAMRFMEELLSRSSQEAFAALGNLSARKDAGEFTRHPLTRRLWEKLLELPVMLPPPDTGYSPELATLYYELCGQVTAGKKRVSEVVEVWNEGKRRLAQKGGL